MKQQMLVEMYYKLKNVKDFSNSYQKINGDDDDIYAVAELVNNYMEILRKKIPKVGYGTVDSATDKNK